MTVLAAAVCTKAGSALLSRQFVEMQRSRIEGLLASFPKLIGSGQEHTFVETDNVRYVYQPMDELYLVLITTKASNILQDLDTLHLFARVVPEYCRTVEEREVRRNAFELIFAFDEIVNLGYRENVNISKIRTLIEADSHDEKIQQMIAKNKEQEAKEAAKLKMKQLEMQRRERQRQERLAGGGGGGGFRNSMYGDASYSSSSSYQSRPTPQESPVYSEPVETRKPSNARPSGRGMKLGGKKEKTSDFFAALKTETGYEEPSAPSSPTRSVASTNQSANQPPMSPQAPTESIHVVLEEKINMTANRDGGIEHMEVKGDLMLRINDPNVAHVKILVDTNTDKRFQFKTHPNVDKKRYAAENVIALKDPSRPFPVNQPLGVLKWRFTSQDESDIPLSVNCWPSVTGDGTFDVNIEYELESEKLELKDVVIFIPIASHSPPVVGDIDGNYYFDRQHHQLEWQIPIIDASNRSGSMEFNCEGDGVDSFFPVSASFLSTTNFCDITVKDIVSVENETPMPFSQEIALVPDEYCVI